MLMKAIFFVAALAVPALALEPVTCDTKPKPGPQLIVTSITPNVGFCTMLTGQGVYPVAPNEGCASVHCYGPSSKLGPPTPPGYILSANYAVTENYTQVTGCIDSATWGQNPTDEGGQMDSHGWPYSCQGFTKFLSLLEPATNTFCLRCCNGTNVDVDCDTSHSTRGCWNLIPGLYQMADGSACKPPVGAPNSTLPSAGVSGALPGSTATGSAPGVAPSNGGSTGSSGSSGSSGSTGGSSGSSNLPPASKTSAAGRASSFLGAAATLAVAAVIASL